MRESHDACAASVLGTRFLPFLVQDVKGIRWRDSKEGFMVLSGRNSCRNENANFLMLHWFKR